VLLAIQLLVLDGYGCGPPLLLLLAGIGAAIGVARRPSWRKRTNLELLKVLWANKLLRFSVIAVVGLAESVALILGIVGANDAKQRAADAERLKSQVQQATARVQELVREADPCAVEKVNTDDLKLIAEHVEKDRATSIRRRYQSKVSRCEQSKLCAKLSASITAGSQPAPRQLPAGVNAGLVERIVGKKLEVDDLKLTDKTTPCTDFESGKNIWASVVKAAADSSNAWGNLYDSTSVSEALLEGLTKRPEPLSGPSRKALHERVKALAKEKAKAATSEELNSAHMLCAMEQKLGYDNPSECQMLEAVQKRLRQRERSAAAAEKARKDTKARADSAKEKRCKDARFRATKCDLNCMEKTDLFDRAAGEACMRRCQANLKAAGCD